jgi:uncharacterized protein
MNMKELTSRQLIFYHLYPGIIIGAAFILVASLLSSYQVPPQLSLMIVILLVALPLLICHLMRVKKAEGLTSIMQTNGFTQKLPKGKLILYVTVLVILSFLIWGLTSPVNKLLNDVIFSHIPQQYALDNFSGYSREMITITLIANLVLNCIAAPVAEELYFRGYLLSRMNSGKWPFMLNAILFSLYHFWQPGIYLTLILSLLPMTYAVWKTKDIRVGIYTHMALNIIGAILSFGYLNQ